MFIEMDADNKLMYVYLTDNRERKSADSKRIGEDLVLDYDAAGKLMGVEFLRLS